MRQEDYPPGTIVFAKLKGYPWWPARIEDEKRVPARVLKQKKTTKSKGPIWTVFFFGSKDYGFFGPDAIRPFDSENVERDLTAKKFKTKELENAVRQALNPSLLQKDEEENDDDEDDEDEQASEEEETAKKSRRTRSARKTTNTADLSSARKKSMTTPSSKKSKNSNSNKKEDDEEEPDEDESPVKSKRRSRKLDEVAVKEVLESPDNGRKKRRKSVSLEKEESHASPAASSRHSDESASEKPKDETEGYEGERRRMYALRRKLQKLVYQKKPGEILKEEYGIISAILRNVEDTHVTHRLLRDTKIATVVKSAGQYVFEDDVKYNIQARARQLICRWRQSFSAARQAENGKMMHSDRKTVIPTSTALPATGTAASKDNDVITETKHQDTMQVDSPVLAAEESKTGEDHEGSGSDAMIIDEAAAGTTVRAVNSANTMDMVMQEAP
ncbi:hypothetical protein BX666DRAFT_1889172 [Dichotomocladium elegans]|nr:hypothetical protein BX666DRAFT_1889172 [Dichotomocladium elegans]